MSARTDRIPPTRTRGGGWSDTGRRWCRSCRAPRRFAVWPALSWMPHISSGSSAGSWTVHPTGGGPSSSADAFRLASPGRRAGTFRDRPVRRCAPTSTYPRRGPATIELGAAQRDIEDPCTPAFALDPAARRMPMRGVRCGLRRLRITARCVGACSGVLRDEREIVARDGADQMAMSFSNRQKSHLRTRPARGAGCGPGGLTPRATPPPGLPARLAAPARRGPARRPPPA